MRVSHLNALRALEATVRNGSFRAASKELGITPAAVSQRVAGLENYVGRKLFLRSPAGAEPTAMAKKYGSTLTSSFLALSNVLEGLEDQNSKNRISLTMTQTFAESWLLPRLSSFYKVGSEIDFRIDTTDRVIDLSTEDIDYGIRFSAPVGDEYDDIPLLNGFAFPLCSPGFASEYDLHPKTSLLENVPLIHIEDPTSDPEWLDWVGWARKFSLSDKGMERGLRFSQIGFGMQAAIAGRGIVLCGPTDAPEALLDGQLINPFGKEFVVQLSYMHRLVSLRDKSKSTLQQSFETWIKDQAQEFQKSASDIIFER